MKGSRVRLTVSVLALMGILLFGCGGGEEGSAGSGAVLEWDPPNVAADGTPMDSRRDVDHFELFLRTDQNFSENDQPVAQVSAFHDVISPDGKTFVRELTKEFEVDNLLPFTEKGKRYFVSIRSVGVDGLRSEFMVPVAWDLS